MAKVYMGGLVSVTRTSLPTSGYTSGKQWTGSVNVGQVDVSDGTRVADIICWYTNQQTAYIRYTLCSVSLAFPADVTNTYDSPMYLNITSTTPAFRIYGGSSDSTVGIQYAQYIRLKFTKSGSVYTIAAAGSPGWDTSGAEYRLFRQNNSGVLQSIIECIVYS